MPGGPLPRSEWGLQDGGGRLPVPTTQPHPFQAIPNPTCASVYALFSAQPPTFQLCSMKGTVKRFYFRKGFGFIEGDQGTEYFFHYTDFTGDKEVLRPGLEVDFEAQQGDKGPCAVAVVQPGGKAAPARTTRPAARGPAKAGSPMAARAYRFFAAGVVLGAVLGAAGHWWLTQL